MVSTALYTGLSGLRSYQTYIDVIGNNLANVSTPGFRSSRATFSDVLSFTVRAGSGPNGTFGGQNPLQIGTGTFMASVDTNTNQGTLQDTGRPLDVALQGRGFFTLTNGTQTFYTRVGSFGIDANNALVDLRTGLKVVSASGSTITVPQTDTLPAKATTSVTFQGNLPAEVGGPLEEILESSVPFNEGTAATKNGVSSPSSPGFDLSAFAGKTLLVSVNGGAQQTLTVPSSLAITGATQTSVINWINSELSGATAAAGSTTDSLSISTTKLGSNANIKFDDGPNSTGLLTALGLDATLVSGTQSAATATTDLNALTARTAPYQNGDAITVSGTNPDGSVFSDTFIYGTDGTTLGSLMTFVNNTVGSGAATATITADGTLRFTAANKGEADLSLFIGDVSGNTGAANWANFEVAQEGTDADSATTSIDVVDAQGRTHPVTMTFTRTLNDPTVWDMVATINDLEGTITQDSIGQIRFNNNGSFNVIGGGTNTLSFSWDGITTAQNVKINLGTSGSFDGVAMLGDATTIAAVDQDGYGAGTLLDAGFDKDGNLVAYYSNGQSQALDQLRISMFGNEGGLVRQGDTLFTESPNSDDAIATTANAAGAGAVRAGQLENSNVDIAVEFVNLIEAQRGFQANSRVITTTDEILAELMNIVR
ncbi:MAG TPA: flagellar hook-basal body complex protein [bacterium]|nr:flagellar hook-basal body complex protein [bacterium]